MYHHVLISASCVGSMQSGKLTVTQHLHNASVIELGKDVCDKHNKVFFTMMKMIYVGVTL